jgi:excisionase family DNA binding protein
VREETQKFCEVLCCDYSDGGDMLAFNRIAEPRRVPPPIARAPKPPRKPPVAALPPVAVSPAKAATMLGIGLTPMLALIRSGELPARRVGRRWLVSVAAIHRFVEGP